MLRFAFNFKLGRGGNVKGGLLDKMDGKVVIIDENVAAKGYGSLNLDISNHEASSNDLSRSKLINGEAELLVIWVAQFPSIIKVRSFMMTA